MAFKLPKLNFRGKTKTKSAKRGGSGVAVASGLGSILSGMFGSTPTIPKLQSKSTKHNISKSGRTGKANYGPLPSFSISTPTAKKYSNPTLAEVSTQLGQILSKVSVIDSTLKSQLDFQKFKYKETARVQREINAESVDSSGLVGVGQDLDTALLSESLLNLSKAIEAVVLSIGSGGLGGNGGLPIVAPTGKDKVPAGAVNNKKILKNHQFVSKDKVFDKNGKLKGGYEPVLAKNSKRVVGYRRVQGAGGIVSRAISRVSPGAGRLASRATNFLGGSKVVKSALSPIASVAKVGKGLTGLAGKALGPALYAYQAYLAIKEIKAIPESTPEEERNQKVKKIVGKLVANIGLVAAGMYLGGAVGGMAGSVVPGPGTAVGTILGLVGGAAGGMAADYFLGDDVDAMTETVIDAVWPAKKPKHKPSFSGASVKPLADKPKSQPQISIPVYKPKTTKARSKTVGEILNSAANRAGIDPQVLRLILSQSGPIDVNKDSSGMSGSAFKLTTAQWNQILQKYGSAFPELSGTKDLKASALGAALLLKDSQDFISKNGITPTPESLYASYLIGPKGVVDLNESDPDSIAADIVPQAALTKPELFTENSKQLSVRDFMSKIYDVTPSQSDKPTASNSSVPKLESAQSPWGQKESPETKSPQDSQSDSSSPTPETPRTPWWQKETPSPDAAATDKPAAAAISAPSTDTSAPQQDAAPVSSVAPSTTGETINQASNEVETMESTPSMSSSGTGGQSSPLTSPSIMPSNSLGYTGSGNVPDPNFSLGDIEEQLFFTSLGK